MVVPPTIQRLSRQQSNGCPDNNPATVCNVVKRAQHTLTAAVRAPYLGLSAARCATIGLLLDSPCNADKDNDDVATTDDSSGLLKASTVVELPPGAELYPTLQQYAKTTSV